MGIREHDITADAFHRDRAGDYELSILTGVDSFAYIVRDRKQQRLLAYRSADLTAVDRKAWPEAFTELVGKDPRLRDVTYGRVMLAWDSPVVTLVPDELYRPGNPSAFLKHLTTLGEGDETRHENIHELAMEAIYADRRDCLLAAERQLRPLRTRHRATGLLSVWGIRSRQAKHRRISCSLRGKWLFVAAHDSGALRFYNTFRIDGVEDAVYYLLLVYDRCAFDPDRDPLYLCGEVVADGELYRQLYRFVREVGFCSPPEPEQDPSALSVLPAHLYFDLLCSGLTEYA